MADRLVVAESGARGCGVQDPMRSRVGRLATEAPLARVEARLPSDRHVAGAVAGWRPGAWVEAIAGSGDCRRTNAAAPGRRGALLEHALSGHAGATAPLHDDQQHRRRDAGERFHARKRRAARSACDLRFPSERSHVVVPVDVTGSSRRATGRSASRAPGLVKACRSCLCRASDRATDAVLSRFVHLERRPIASDR